MRFPLFSLIGRSLLVRSIYLSRPFYNTYYDILKVPRNCSSKDIRNSFIKLSKEYHPDKNSKDPELHNKFVRLNEAYRVLSRPELRHEYDLGLIPEKHSVDGARKDGQAFTSRRRKTFYDSSLYENRDRSKDAENAAKPYYGIKGVGRVSNKYILTLCLVFAAFGVYLQVLLINRSTTFSRKVLDEQNIRNAKIVSQVRKEAEEYGDEAVFERMRKNEERYKDFQRQFGKDKD